MPWALIVRMIEKMSRTTSGARPRDGSSIIISFGCYLAVVLGARKHPKLGMLMMPKTLAYVWMLLMCAGI